MPRTVEDIEADIASLKSNPNWSTDTASMNLFTELLKEKNQLGNQNSHLINFLETIPNGLSLSFLFP